jgi:hypothetical protein
MTTLMFAAALMGVGSSPVVLEAKPTKPAYNPGEEVVIQISVRNQGKQPVIVATAGAPDYPYANVHSVIQDSKANKLPVLSNFTLGQWMVGHTITPRHFVTLKPGESAVLTQEKFKEYWSGKVPNLKSELAETPKSSFAAGSYAATYNYSWKRELNKDNRRRAYANRTDGFNFPFEFRDGARSLYDKAFEGELKAIVTFKVK